MLQMNSPAIAGTAVIYSISPTTSTRIGLLIAFYCTQFILAEGNLLFSLISRNVAGQTKKSTVHEFPYPSLMASFQLPVEIEQPG